jgi:hypothetical protein
MLYVPKRRNLRKIKRKTICRFPSVKGDVPVVLTEGTVEKDFCYYLELDPLVKLYQCQPLGYYYYLNGEKRSYTPDFEVDIDGGVNTYYEVKELEYLNDDEDFEIEFEAKKKQAEILGKQLILVCDDFIRQQPKLTNIRRVYGAKRRGRPSDEFVNSVVKIIDEHEPITAEELMVQLDMLIGQIYQLIYYKVVLADFDNTFGPEMMLWRR